MYPTKESAMFAASGASIRKKTACVVYDGPREWRVVRGLDDDAYCVFHDDHLVYLMPAVDNYLVRLLDNYFGKIPATVDELRGLLPVRKAKALKE